MFSVPQLARAKNLVRFSSALLPFHALILSCYAGLTRDIATGLLPEFDREMRRRVWCIIQVLDWLVNP